MLAPTAFNPPTPLPADRFAREEAWIASGTGETIVEFEARYTLPRAPVTETGECRIPPPDTGIYMYR